MDAGSVKSVSFDKLDGSKVRIGIISTRWNPKVVDALQEGAKKTLLENGVVDDNVFETSVPGSWELPVAARFLALSATVDAIICVGCLIKGETSHYEYIADTVSTGLMSVQLQTSVPCIFGVLTCLTEEQAAARSYSGENHGVSWAKTAIEMASLRQSALGIDKKTTLNLGFGKTDGDEPKPFPKAAPDKKIYF